MQCNMSATAAIVIVIGQMNTTVVFICHSCLLCHTGCNLLWSVIPGSTNNMPSETADFAFGAATWRSQRNIRVVFDSTHLRYCVNT